MSSRNLDAVLASRYWITPAGCAAAGGHRPDLDKRHCRVCGGVLEEAMA